jgi:hypothetical protein
MKKKNHSIYARILSELSLSDLIALYDRSGGYCAIQKSIELEIGFRISDCGFDPQPLGFASNPGEPQRGSEQKTHVEFC